jgi:hypothetical protein
MKDIILDIVKHTAGLGFIESAKVTSTKETTTIEAMDTDRTVILNAVTHTNVEEFNGEFGLGNLSFLNGVLGLNNYQEVETDIQVKTRSINGDEVPESLTFEDQYGNTDQYRFMSKEIVNQQLRTVKFKGAKWDVQVTPTKPKVSELGQVATIYDPTFSASTVNGNLVFTLGTADGTGHFGKRIFANNVEGDLKQNWSWPLLQVLGILKLGMSGNCIMKLSDQGALMIAIDSGLANYEYILPAMSK